MTYAIQLVNRVQNVLERLGHPPALGRGQAQLLQQRKDFRVTVYVHIFVRPGSVKHDAERTFRHDRWIELL